MSDRVVFAQLSGAVRWGGGTTVLKLGTRYSADDPLVQARPDLFGADDPTLRSQSTVAAKPTRRCWSCGKQYAPIHPGQRYCSHGCRRDRERLLTRAARRAVAGERSDPKRPRSGARLAELHTYRQELNGRIAELEMLCRHLLGRTDPYDTDHRTPDEATLQVSNRPAFVALVKGEIERLAELRRMATERLVHAEAGEDAERDLEVYASTVLPGNPRQRAWQQQVATWTAQLEAADG